MPLYRASVTQFRVQMMDGSLVPTLTTQYRHHVAHNPAPAEVRSWERSLHALSADLIQAGLDDVEVLVEHQLPLTSKRADVVLCGVHPRTGDPSYVVVELKQWSEATLLEDSLDLCVVPGVAGVRLHPGEQVRRYCGHLQDFLATLSDLDDPIAGVAYLHNATDQGVDELFELPEDDQGRLFTGQRRAELLDYLTGRLAPASGAAAADVTVGDWKRPWNNKKETSVGGAPGRSFWSSDPAGFGQVGCVYTAQGFEYDWSGVIMGPDLVWRDDRWVAQPGGSHDSAVRRAPLADFDQAVRNTYKVLLTRGMAGSVVLSTDPETQVMLGSLLGRVPAVTS